MLLQKKRRMQLAWTLSFLLLQIHTSSSSFVSPASGLPLARGGSPSTFLSASITQAEADKVITAAKRKLADRTVVKELGKLIKVTNVLGFGAPEPDTIAVRFQAQFQKSGNLPSLLGQKAKQNGRGVLNGQVSCKSKYGKIIQLSIARDGGWGKTLEVKC